MPIFDYRCCKYPLCDGFREDVLMREKKFVFCPKCGSVMLKEIGGTNLTFKMVKGKDETDNM